MDKPYTARIKKHWFGLFRIYVEAAAAILIVLITAALLWPSAPQDVIWLGIVAVAIIIVAVVAINIYSESYITILTKRLIITNQLTLFAQTSGECLLSEIEDVSVKRPGFFGYLLDFGTLTVHTVGFKENLMFTMCPGPFKLRGKLLDASELSTKD